MSADAVSEALSVAIHLKERAPQAFDDIQALLHVIDIQPSDTYDDKLDEAVETLANGPASRNGSTRDAHILALAWTYDADIWSHDRDFAGTGWPSWSSANLAAALSEEAQASAAQPA